jgi:hypothetical protein
LALQAGFLLPGEPSQRSASSLPSPQCTSAQAWGQGPIALAAMLVGILLATFFASTLE